MEFYAKHKIDLCFVSAERIEVDSKRVITKERQIFAYDVLLLATGASAVPPPFPGSELDGVVTFDTLADANEIIAKCRRAKSAIVAGGGITALELAEGLNRQGVKTTLLQRKGRIWPRLFDDKESAIVAEAVRHEGIKVIFNEEITEINGKKGRVQSVKLKSDNELKCQIVGVAIGVRPSLALVRDTTIRTDRGIPVDPYLQTSVPGIFAAGDVAQVLDRWTGKYNLDVLWPSAINEGRAAGYNMVDAANGIAPTHLYQKGSPFNAALLCGIHLTVIGHVGSQDDGTTDEFQHLSRGSSSVWTSPFSKSYRSAWDSKGPNSLRIVISDGKIAGALILGDQQMADPLRELIENEVDIAEHQSELLSAGDNLPKMLLAIWQKAQRSKV
jgi:NAD(P)H-nitrite reductase large subunit